MKRGIKLTLNSDVLGREFVRLEKVRGKFTLDEIEEILRYEDNGRWNGRYTIILKCTQGGDFDGYWGEEPPGDMVELYRLEDMGNCPVCGKLLPPFEFCPHCGKRWNVAEVV